MIVFLLRDNVARTLHARDQERIYSLTGFAIFVEIKKRREFRHPNKIRMPNLQCSAICQMNLKWPKRRKGDQVANLLQHVTIMSPAFSACK